MGSEQDWERGAETIKAVYAGDVIVPPRGAMRFSDLMLESLFANVWSNETLAMRDRRLILLGAIGALGEKDTFAIQCKAALKNGELDAAQMREVLVMLANYAGYPRAAGLIGVVEQTIAAVAKEQADG